MLSTTGGVERRRSLGGFKGLPPWGSVAPSVAPPRRKSVETKGTEAAGERTESLPKKTSVFSVSRRASGDREEVAFGFDEGSGRADAENMLCFMCVWRSREWTEAIVDWSTLESW